MKKKKKAKVNSIPVSSLQKNPLIIDVSGKKAICISSDTHELTSEQIEKLIKELERNREIIESLYFSSDAAIERIESRSWRDLLKIKMNQLKQRKELQA